MEDGQLCQTGARPTLTGRKWHGFALKSSLGMAEQSATVAFTLEKPGHGIWLLVEARNIESPSRAWLAIGAAARRA